MATLTLSAVEKKLLLTDVLIQQTGFHVRSSMKETKDLPVSKGGNKSFLAEGDTYAYRVSTTTAVPLTSSSSVINLASSLCTNKTLGVRVWPLEVRGHLFYTWADQAHPVAGVPSHQVWPSGRQSWPECIQVAYRDQEGVLLYWQCATSKLNQWGVQM